MAGTAGGGGDVATSEASGDVDVDEQLPEDEACGGEDWALCGGM